MNCLLDTHIIIWFLRGDRQADGEIRSIVSNRQNTIYFSAASIWEIAIKHAKNPQLMPFSGTFLAQKCRMAMFRELPISVTHTSMVDTLQIKDGKSPHADPFDRILLAQAKAENMRFVTHDAVFKRYDESCLMIV